MDVTKCLINQRIAFVFRTINAAFHLVQYCSYTKYSALNELLHSYRREIRRLAGAEHVRGRPELQNEIKMISLKS